MSQFGNAKLNGTSITGHQNASFRFTPSPNITPNGCLSSFMIESAFRIFFVFFNPMSRLNFFNWVKKVSFSFYKTVIYKRQMHLISSFVCFNQNFSNFCRELFSSSYIYIYMYLIFILPGKIKWRLKLCWCIWCLEMIKSLQKYTWKWFTKRNSLQQWSKSCKNICEGTRFL